MGHFWVGLQNRYVSYKHSILRDQCFGPWGYVGIGENSSGYAKLNGLLCVKVGSSPRPLSPGLPCRNATWLLALGFLHSSLNIHCLKRQGCCRLLLPRGKKQQHLNFAFIQTNSVFRTTGQDFMGWSKTMLSPNISVPCFLHLPISEESHCDFKYTALLMNGILTYTSAIKIRPKIH